MSEVKPPPRPPRATRASCAASQPTLLGDIETGDEGAFLSGIREQTRVLSTGAVAPRSNAHWHEPGISKSRSCSRCARRCRNTRVLYVSGESLGRSSSAWPSALSSPSCLPLRDRLIGSDHQRTRSHGARHSHRRLDPDSLKRDLTAAPGGTERRSRNAMSLVRVPLKQSNDHFHRRSREQGGHLAGPKILEHRWGCVLYFEG